MKLSAYLELLVYCLSVTYSSLLLLMPLHRMFENYKYFSVVVIFYLVVLTYLIGFSTHFVRSFFLKKYRANDSLKMLSLLSFIFILPYTFVKFRELIAIGNIESKLFVGFGLALMFFSILNIRMINHHALES
jgi:hypothetical protein